MNTFFMDVTPSRDRFDAAYREGSPPWVIGEPQPSIVELERRGLVTGKVLDVGCGTGEHTILLTSLGYDVLGIDYSPHAIDHARANAEAKGIDARFEVADATKLTADAIYDTIIDSALFHIFAADDRHRYARSLHTACRPGGVVHLLALSDAGRGFGPQISDAAIREAFRDGWELEAIDTVRYRGVVGEAHSELLQQPVGARVDELAWLARIRRQ